MQREKIAAIGLVIIIVVVLSAFLAFTYGDQILEILSGEKNTILKALDDNIVVNVNAKNKTINFLDNDKYSDINNLSTSIIVKPSHGIVEVLDNEITYTPNENYTGTDSFKYRINDSKGKTSEATVTIEISYGVIDLGDCVDVYYVGKFTNGTIFDTNKEDIAKQSGIFNETKKIQGFYNVSKVFADPELMYYYPPDGYENYSSTYFPIGFLNSLIGMKEGETKTITLDAENAYGEWDESYGEQLCEAYFGTPYWPRKTSNPLEETMLKENLTYYNSSINISNIKINQIIDTMTTIYLANGSEAIMQLQVTNISDENVTIKNLIPNGSYIKIEGFWDQVFIIENETTFTMRSDAVLGEIYGYPQGWIKILDIDEEKIIIGINIVSPEKNLIGETLIYQIEIEKVYKTSELLES